MKIKKKLKKKIRIKLEPNGKAGKYVLQLFVTGLLPNSARAIENISTICEKYLKGRYELEIIDIYQQPALALTADIIAVPILIKKFPLPEARLIGDLSNTQRVLTGLHINYSL